MPETRAVFQTRYSVWREVVSVKVYAPGHESVWLPVEGPLTGLDLMETPQGTMLLLRLLPTPDRRERAIDLVGRHGWPPGPTQTMGDVVVEPDVRRQMAELMVRFYEQLLADFPQYQNADRVRVKIASWKRDLI